MKQFCYVILNNAGHSWAAHSTIASAAPEETPSPPTILPQLLQEGWVPVRETPMGGGTSPLAHSLILLERALEQAAKPRAGRGARSK